MLSSILALPPDVAQRLDQYASAHSTGLASNLVSHYEWTRTKYADADRSSSLLQAQWMAQRARELGAKRGLSTLAWYVGTKDTSAQIYTIENVPDIAAAAKDTFREYCCDDRVHIIKGSAHIAQLTEPFDIIFIDLEFSAYLPIVKQVLNRHLLAPYGVMLVNNIFARGFTVNSTNYANIDLQLHSYWVEAGQLVRDFNSFVLADPRVTVTILPFFDGISEIRMRG